MSEAERAIRKNAISVGSAKALAILTVEERAERKKSAATRTRELWRSMSPAKRAAIVQRRNASIKRAWVNKSPEQRRAQMATAQASVTPEVRTKAMHTRWSDPQQAEAMRVMIAKSATISGTKQKARWSAYSDEERNQIKAKMTEGKLAGWAALSEEEKLKRIEQNRIGSQAFWDALSDEERALRIANMRRAVKLTVPNKCESRLATILDQNFPGEFKINVKGEVIIDNRIPDFVSATGKPIVVELFGDYWHGTLLIGKRTREEEERQRREIFARHGIETVIIWESVLRKHPQQIPEMIRVTLESVVARACLAA